MQTLVIRHAVKDFDTWMSFDQARKTNILANGATAVRTFQDHENPNSVLMIIDLEDLKKFQAMMNSDRANEVRAKHGVLDPVVFSREIL